MKLESIAKRQMAGQVIFPLLESWNPIAKIATIVAERDRKRILCRIPLDVLESRYEASADAPMNAVTCHRDAIREAASALIRAEAFEDDGSVMIR
jgi:hypothetical protein